MILTENMKNMRIYKCETFLPTLKEDKKKNSAIIMLTPNRDSSMKLMNHPLFVNKKRYESYYLDRDVSYYIGSKKLEEVDENFLYLEETKRSELKDSDFGIPEDRKFPLDTAQHVNSAIKLFGHAEESKKKSLARRIARKAKSYNIEIPKTTQVYKYLHESVLTDYPNRKNLVFDFGSVLVEEGSVEDMKKSLPDIPEKLFFEVYNAAYDMFEKTSHETSTLKEEIEYISNKVSDEAKQYIVPIYKAIIGAVHPFDYTDKLLDSLKSQGYNLYYISNWNKSSFEINYKLGTFKFIDKMNGGVISYQVGTVKPNSDIYEILCDRYNLDPSTCVFFDDREENIESAEVLGFKGILFDQDIAKSLISEVVTESFQPSKKNDNLYFKFSVPQKDIIDIKFEMDEKENRWNSVVLVEGIAPKTLRGRSECLVIKDNEIYLDETEDGICSKGSLAKIMYDVPGGGWDPNEPHDICAIRETNEEAKIKVKDISYVDNYLNIDKERPEGCYCDGLFSEVYIGKYDGKYTEPVADVDRADIAVSGKFYPIKDVFGYLNPIHQKAIIQYFGDNIINIINPEDYENPIDESYINEANNDPNYSMYIVSDEYLGDKKELKPSIPKDQLTKKGIKNKEVERVVFYPSINNALLAAGNDVNEKREMFVHVPVENQKVKGIKPTSKDVPDISNTGEIWVKEPIKVKCIGKIRVGKQLKKYTFEVDDKTYNEFSWNYSWLTKQDKHVQNDYSPEEKREKKEEEDDQDIKTGFFETVDALPALDHVLNTGDKLIFFGEDAKYDTQLKRLLYNSRMKQRKEVVLLYDEVKKQNPWIKYTFPDINKYLHRNMFVDTYFYTQNFFANNTWKLQKGLTLYTEFLTRLINNPTLKNAGYKRITLMIPVDDWDKNHNGTLWNYRADINPLSMMYNMMFTLHLKDLQKIFGDMDIIFTTRNKYFKMNFMTIDEKESKKFANKFKLFLIKFSKNEEFDAEDIDTSSDHSDSPDVLKAKIADKIEDAKGVDITPELAKAEKKRKEESKTLTKLANNTKPKAPINTTTDKAKEQKEEIKSLDNTTKASKNQVDKAKVKEENQAKKERIADAIDNAVGRDNAFSDKTEDDVIDSLDFDPHTKLDLLTLEPDDNVVNISAGRAARMTELDRKVMNATVKGKSVKDILNDTSNKEEVKTKLDISDPIGEYSELTFMNFDKNYNPDQDIINCFRHFSDTSIPVSMKDIKVTDNSTSEDRVELYTVEMEDYSGKRFTIKLDIPIAKDNRYLLRGNTKAIQTQLFTMPILKVDLNSAQVVSNYSKIILTRFKTGNGRALPMTAKLIKAIGKYEGNKIKFITGDNTKVSNKYDLPVDYIDLGAQLSKIITKDQVIYFNQDELRNDYQVDDSKGLPIGIDKKSNTIIYYTDEDSYGVTMRIYDMLNCYDEYKDFIELWDSMSKPSTCTYTRAKIMSVEMPLVIICGYHEGLRSAMDKGAIKYEIKDKLDKDDKTNPRKDYIKFSDGYLVYYADQAASLFLNGLKDQNTSDYSIADIDNKNMYLEMLDNYGGRIKADGLDNAYDLMMDPMTVDSLRYYHLPTDYIQVLMYANSLLSDNKFIRHTETATKRFRRGQLIAVYTYKVLANAYREYANQVRHGAVGSAKMVVKQSDVIDTFLADPITSDDSTINALRDIETTNSVTTKGPSGMNSQRAYSLDKRTYDDSMLNVFGISTGFASNVGITRQATLNANVTPEGYTKVINGDTSKMNTVNTLTATEALTPFGSTHDDPMRTAMTFIQTSKHQVRTVESDPALVTNGSDEAMPYMSSDRFAFKAKKSGKIIEISDNYVLIEYDDGEKDLVNLMEIIDKNSDGGYYVPLKLDLAKGMKVGKKIKENDIIAFDKESYSDELGETGNLAYNIGKLTKVAIINSDEGFEDSGIITESLAKKLATRVDYQYSMILDKQSIIYNIAKVGQHIEAGESLMTWQNPFEDEDANAIMKTLGASADEVSNLGKRELVSTVTGTVKGIKIFRTVELDELSDSLKKIVNDYEKPLRQMEKVVKANNLDISQVPAHYKLDTVGKLKKAEDSVLVEIYVEYTDINGIGDKIVAYSANKMVIKQIIPQELAPYTDFRPNEKIDAFLSESSIDKRLVASTLIFGSISKLMIELDRSVKDIMGISYDDSTI